jgi:hypothetical protein
MPLRLPAHHCRAGISVCIHCVRWQRKGPLCVHWHTVSAGSERARSVFAGSERARSFPRSPRGRSNCGKTPALRIQPHPCDGPCPGHLLDPRALVPVDAAGHIRPRSVGPARPTFASWLPLQPCGCCGKSPVQPPRWPSRPVLIHDCLWGLSLYPINPEPSVRSSLP